MIHKSSKQSATRCNLLVYAIAMPTFLIATSSLADLSTLFTTPAERQMIDSHRYRLQPVKRAANQTVTAGHMQKPIDQVVQQSLDVNGIALSNQDRHRVWINQQVYQDGDQIEGNSRVKIIVGNKIKVRITTPDGKNYFAVSGETIQIGYSGRL